MKVGLPFHQILGQCELASFYNFTCLPTLTTQCLSHTYNVLRAHVTKQRCWKTEIQLSVDMATNLKDWALKWIDMIGLPRMRTQKPQPPVVNVVIRLTQRLMHWNGIFVSSGFISLPRRHKGQIQHYQQKSSSWIFSCTAEHLIWIEAFYGMSF